MATEQQPQQPQQQQQQQQQPQQPQQHTGALARAGAEEQGLRTTFSCVFEGFSRELSRHYIINTNCNALYSPIHYRKVANM